MVGCRRTEVPNYALAGPTAGCSLHQSPLGAVLLITQAFGSVHIQSRRNLWHMEGCRVAPAPTLTAYFRYLNYLTCTWTHRHGNGMDQCPCRLLLATSVLVERERSHQRITSAQCTSLLFPGGPRGRRHVRQHMHKVSSLSLWRCCEASVGPSLHVLEYIGGRVEYIECAMQSCRHDYAVCTADSAVQ